MANDPSRGSLLMHYAIMGTIVVWIVGLGVYVFA
jgi:hypothetical protein